jgi:hypothetical protein
MALGIPPEDPSRGLDFVFKRRYNSGPTGAEDTGPTGRGWTHAYNMRLVATGPGSP